MAERTERSVLIYDEAGFSRVCSALLEMSGHTTHIVGKSTGAPIGSDVGLFVTSYPYGAFMLEEVTKRSIPAIVLFDNIDERFDTNLHQYGNLYGMIKPIDYDKFKDLVRRLLAGEEIPREDYSIII